MKKRILILANTGSGLYAFRKELIYELLKENEVYISIPDHVNEKDLINLGARIMHIKFERRGMNPIKDLVLIRQYNKLIKTLKPNIVLTYTIKPNIYGGLICAHQKVSYIVNITGLGTSIENKGILSKILMILYKRVLKFAKICFFQNLHNEQILLKNNECHVDYQILPGSGVNLDDNPLEEYPQKNDSLSFITVGRIMKDKGMDEYINCVQFIKQKYPSCNFYLAGGYDEITYKEKIDSLHNAHFITYLGERDDIHQCMAKCHAIIHPSYHEGLSNVLLEAAACGRPVIATNVSGCKETYDDGITGIGFEVRNSNALIEAVEKFISLPYEKKKEMGILGRKKVEREFDRKIVIDAYLKAINN